jgi:hypothetical protein
MCDNWKMCHPPTVTVPQKLWNAYVVGGDDGPMLVCEWRDKGHE